MSTALEYNHSPGNLYHKLLIEKGQKVVNDFIGGLAHGYVFDCGCRRTYLLSYSFPVGESERLVPCEKHAADPDILAVN